MTTDIRYSDGVVIAEKYNNAYHSIEQKNLKSDLLNRVLTAVGKPALKLLASTKESLTFSGGMPKSAPFEWPRKENRPLGFVAQVDLSEHQLIDIDPRLPEKGRLLFFYDLEEQPWGFDPKHKGGWKVIFDDSNDEPKSILPPEDLNDIYKNTQVTYLLSDRFISIPSPGGNSLKELKMTEDEEDDYCDLYDDIDAEEPRHQIGGYPDLVQGDEMEEECQLALGGFDCRNSPEAIQLLKKENDWKLLLQFETDGDAIWGMLYFWIKQSHAKSKNFQDTWMILQCT
jgi:uncharacterized protein YwqG